MRQGGVALADGYCSDDVNRPKAVAHGYGALLGILPKTNSISSEAALAYQIRQCSSGSKCSKVSFLDAVLARPSEQPPSRAQTKPRTPFEKHCVLISLLPRTNQNKRVPKSDFQLLQEAHRFLRTEADEDGSWEARLARRYYDRLFREYVICDLAGYQKGCIGFRWRTEAEVAQGKGQFICAHKMCSFETNLSSYEVDFKYREAGYNKRALVKVRLCEKCAYKLYFKRLKAERRHRKVHDGCVEDEAKDPHQAKRKCTFAREDDQQSLGEEDMQSEEAGEGACSTDALPNKIEKRRLEALAWRGPDPEVMRQGGVALADGYCSDDVNRPKAVAHGYGALLGILPKTNSISSEAALAYQIRQCSSGSKCSKVSFLDAVLARPSEQPPSRAQTKPRTPFEKHCVLISLLPRTNQNKRVPKSDFQLLQEAHRFLRTEADEDGSWEARLARRYYDRLFREYVICDLAGYQKGCIGFRWRTEAEVAQGKGQFICAHKMCSFETNLSSYEVDFKYREAGYNKRALVKVRLCEKCAYKLYFKRLKAERRHRKVHDGCVEDEAKDPHQAKRKCTFAREDDQQSLGEEDMQSEEAGEGACSTDALPNKIEKRRLEALAWRGPDPEARSRDDDFDDYFKDLLM
eukprot:TRINITY_DN13478_c0_g1_i1.p1 TRINITY_DN13478_c0_g1~~TRINITY_DN13478_c0_g1_i1.p1  ORF type:complete len:633 (+),score=81.57 TRINITY_DN13478_c0_g1_i1:73-1971(+)